MAKKSFMKKILGLSFVQLTIFTIWQMAVFTFTGNEADTLIQWFYTFWGIEVSLLMIKKIIEKHEGNKSLDDNLDCMSDDSDENELP